MPTGTGRPTRRPPLRTPRQLAHLYARGRYCGEPGLVWYSRAWQVPGRALTVGDWLDSDDHRGACRIKRIDDVDAFCRVAWYAMATDGQEIDPDTLYTVVDPDSLVTPDGSPPRPTCADWRAAFGSFTHQVRVHLTRR